MAILNFDKDKALQADAGGKGITTSGVYFGRLTKAILGKSPNGANTFECAFEEHGTGKSSNFITIYLTDNKGEPCFGMDKLHSLLGLLGLSKVETEVKVSEDGTTKVTHIPELTKPQHSIGVVLQRNDYKNKKGEDKYTMDILHFLDPKTKQTFTEKENGLEAATHKREVKDKSTSAAKKSSAPEGWQDDAEAGDDLPF